MWLFNRDGFFSVVNHDNIDECVLVRARFEGDLENMITHLCCSVVVLTEVMHTPDHDYPYRVIIQKTAWAKYVSDSAEGIDYTNFKDAVVPFGTEDRERSDKYHEVWAVMKYGRDFDIE